MCRSAGWPADINLYLLSPAITPLVLQCNTNTLIVFNHSYQLSESVIIVIQTHLYVVLGTIFIAL